MTVEDYLQITSGAGTNGQAAIVGACSRPSGRPGIETCSAPPTF
jgi:hypothetical protein